jgi:hypothetical protein
MYFENIQRCFFWLSLSDTTLIADRYGVVHFRRYNNQSLQQAWVAASRRHHFARRRQTTNLQPQL